MPDYCVEDGCWRVATHGRPEGMVGEWFVEERVCSRHASPSWLARLLTALRGGGEG